MQTIASGGIGTCEIHASGRFAKHRDLSIRSRQHRTPIEEQRSIDDLLDYVLWILRSGCHMFHRGEIQLFTIGCNPCPLHKTWYSPFYQILFKCLNTKISFARGDTLKIQRTVRKKFNKQTVSVTPPPSYATLFNRSRNKNKVWTTDTFAHTPPENGDGVRQMINGRNYVVFKTNHGETRLIPVRTPSAALFEYAYTKWVSSITELVGKKGKKTR